MPAKELFVPFARQAGTMTYGQIGAVIPSANVLGTLAGGFQCPAFRVPCDMDTSRPSYVYTLLAAAASLVFTSKAIVLYMPYTIATPNVGIADGVPQCTVQVPDNWQVDVPMRTLMDTGAGDTFPAHTFDPNDYIGLVMYRLGGSAADTYTGLLKIALGLQFRYYLRCQIPCCT